MESTEAFDLENYRLDLIRKPSATLVVSFEPMTACLRNPSRDRLGWSHAFLKNRSESVLYVKPMQPNWYRRPDLFRWMEKNTNLFSQFDRVVPMGGSMGGYGALAFAKAMQATEVLSLNPQSTLAKDLAPWDNRFPLGNAEDWSGEFRDASENLSGDVYVIADRFEEKDWRHVKRLGDVHQINFPLVGHKIPMWLLQLNGLKPISEVVLDGESSADVVQTCRKIIRSRRALERWWAGLVDVAERHRKLETIRKLVTPERVGASIPMQGNEKRTKMLAAKLYRCVAESQTDPNSETSLEWLDRAKEIEACL